MLGLVLVVALLAAPTMPKTVPPNIPRQDCESIRGTDYLHDEERTFYLANCLYWEPYSLPVLATIRLCESGGDYTSINAAGYYGAYQFDLGTWYSVGGVGYPHLATPQEQDYRALLLYQRRGVYPWLNCAIKKGLL